MQNSKSRHILVIEDNEIFLRMLQLRLELNGYIVTPVTEGIRGFDLIRKLRPDLVILDLRLSEMTTKESDSEIALDQSLGHKICRMIKFDRTLKSIPVLVLSCSDSPEDIQTALKCGADSYQMKNKSMNAIMAEIDRLLSFCSTAEELSAADRLMVSK